MTTSWMYIYHLEKKEWLEKIIPIPPPDDGNKFESCTVGGLSSALIGQRVYCLGTQKSSQKEKKELRICHFELCGTPEVEKSEKKWKFLNTQVPMTIEEFGIIAEMKSYSEKYLIIWSHANLTCENAKEEVEKHGPASQNLLYFMNVETEVWKIVKIRSKNIETLPYVRRYSTSSIIVGNTLFFYGGMYCGEVLSTKDNPLFDDFFSVNLDLAVRDRFIDEDLRDRIQFLRDYDEVELETFKIIVCSEPPSPHQIDVFFCFL